NDYITDKDKALLLIEKFNVNIFFNLSKELQNDEEVIISLLKIPKIIMDINNIFTKIDVKFRNNKNIAIEAVTNN
ncbi:MAG: hypothetical protein U9Q66_04360, partial [Patescibacteria group bacterium]|nr:hypothetical protein [Patescibacteria group bacterium]